MDAVDNIKPFVSKFAHQRPTNNHTLRLLRTLQNMLTTNTNNFEEDLTTTSQNKPENSMSTLQTKSLHQSLQRIFKKESE